MLDWLLIRWKYKLDMEGTMTVGDIVNSLMSMDKDMGEEDELEERVWLPELQGSQQPPPVATAAAATGATTAGYHHRRNGSLVARSQVPTHGSGPLKLQFSCKYFYYFE